MHEELFHEISNLGSSIFRSKHRVLLSWGWLSSCPRSFRTQSLHILYGHIFHVSIISSTSLLI